MTDDGREEGRLEARRGGDRKGPRVFVGGVLVSGGEAGRGPRPLILALLAVIAAALSVFLSAGLFLSCSSSVGAELRADGGARISLAAEIPAPVAERVRKLASLPPDAPLFDPAALGKAAAGRGGLRVLSASSPGPSSIVAEFEAPGLAALSRDPELARAGIATFTTGPGWAELRLRIRRGDGRTLVALFPGVDPALLEALYPPLVSGDELSAAEYREMLASLMGERVMPAVDATLLRVTLKAPGPVLEHSGGSLAGQVLSASLGSLELLVLEKPIELRLRWRT